jgi:hypothetical protein
MDAEETVTVPASGSEIPALNRGFRVWKSQLAPESQVRQWFRVSAVIVTIMLVGVAVVSTLLPADIGVGHRSLLFDLNQGIGDAIDVFARNMLVLGIHLGACLVGAIVGREFAPAPATWGVVGKLHRPVPDWLGQASLIYALSVTLFSVALQTTGLGFSLADISAASNVPSTRLLLLVLPHAIPELIAVFLPLGLFLIQARRHQLRPLRAWSWQAFWIAVPILIVAALWETFVTPLVMHAALGF